MIAANDPKLKSWIEVPAGSDFPIQNLPLGIFSTEEFGPRPCTIIGNQVIDLQEISEKNFLNGCGIPQEAFHQPTVNDMLACGKPALSQLRQRLSDLFREDTSYPTLKDNPGKFLHSVTKVNLHLPIQVGDYTDFYSSKEHATNLGMMFRDPANALLPNWLHIPVGYHGRASSIVVSGTPIKRPAGQMTPDGTPPPVFGPSKRLDFELEMAFIVGKNTNLGEPIPIDKTDDYIVGMMLFNDWSARDIQQWEYVPLGPFLGKNFASTASPWVVLMEALEPFRCESPVQDPPVLPYLVEKSRHNYDIHLQVAIGLPDGQEATVSNSNFKYMYWTMNQQLAHHTVNGCNVRVGDLCASGTISGPTPDSYGSMIELAWKGTKPIQMPDGTTRTFINDGDSVILRGWCEKNGVRIGFGECRGTVLSSEF